MSTPSRYRDPYPPVSLRGRRRVTHVQEQVGESAVRIEGAAFLTFTSLNFLGALCDEEQRVIRKNPVSNEPRAHAVVDAFTSVSVLEIHKLAY